MGLKKAIISGKERRKLEKNNRRRLVNFKLKRQEYASRDSE